MAKRTKRMDAGQGIVAYMRVSTRRQKQDSQEKVLREYVANHGLDVTWYSDVCSGKTTDRPGFEKLQADIFAGRVGKVLVYRLDRISRKMVDGVRVLHEWADKGIEVVAVAQGLEFNGSTGKLLAHIMLALSEWERETLIERTLDGLDAARAAGKTLGRPVGCRSRWSPSKRKVDPALAQSLREQGASVKDIAERFGCTTVAVYAVLHVTPGTKAAGKLHRQTRPAAQRAH